MARIRTIKPEFFTSDDIVRLTPLSRVFYVSLWCESDREGRLVWSPNALKRRYLPEDKCDIMAVAMPLIEAGLVVLYEDDEVMYAHIPSFKRHQVINNREAESEIPAPRPEKCVNARDALSRVKDACTRGSVEGRKGRKEGTPAIREEDTRFAEFWDSWPKSERKQDRKRCAERWVSQDLDAQAEAILSDVDARKGWDKWTQDGGKYIEAPLVYLNNERWKDGAGQGSSAASGGRFAGVL